MSYYDNQESVANIYVGLVERGWKCYGYKQDQSDSMTDYWSPARWDGLAEKDGFILLVDVYSTSMSGHKVTEQEYTPDYSKIEKLKATINDKAASENEKETAQKIISSMLEKKEKSMVIVEEYPTFKYANPKRNNWHLEKDGEIIAKGNGAFKCDGYLFGNYEKETMKKVNAFIDRVESFMNSNEQLEKVIVKQVKKIIKPVEITDRKTIQVGDVLSFSYHGHFWQVISINDKSFVYELLGSEKRGYQRLTNGKRYYDYLTKFEKNLEEGKVKIHTLQEVEEVIEKVTYKKTKRKQKGQEDNLLHGETVSNIPESKANEVKETVQETTVNTPESTEKAIITYETGTGSKGNGIEISFTEKPSEEVRNMIKSYGYHWGGKNRENIWWAILNDKTLSIAKQLAGDTNENSNNSEPVKSPDNSSWTYPEMEINDIENYVIDQQLQDREHESNWLMRTKKPDRTREIQDYFSELTNEVKEIIKTTDNEYIIYKLKKTLQYYKKHYYENFVARLRNKADNPSWIITGMDGRNRSRDMKMSNRYDNLMRQFIELDNDYKRRINSLKSKIRKDKEDKIKQQIQDELKQPLPDLTFKTVTKEFDLYGNGAMIKTRLYECEGYSICKAWGAFRIYETSTGKEIWSTKSNGTLKDAKAYVSLLVKKQRQMAV